MRDFTTQKYEQLCLGLLEGGYKPVTLYTYLSEHPFDERICILRHDVDRKLKNALIMAELEYRMGIKSTYYFRYPYTFDPNIILNIASLGHEIGYHYETLAKTGGDHKMAIRLFDRELREFKKIVDVKTICMHGSPLSKFDNRELWKYENFSKFGIIGEAYLSIKKVNYFSDTGRKWNSKNNIRDFLYGNSKNPININNTDELVSLTKRREIERFYILTHPERWSSNISDWANSYLKDCAFNIGKKVLKTISVKRY